MYYYAKNSPFQDCFFINLEILVQQGLSKLRIKGGGFNYEKVLTLLLTLILILPLLVGCSQPAADTEPETGEEGTQEEAQNEAEETKGDELKG